jgi:hypothetical protein
VSDGVAYIIGFAYIQRNLIKSFYYFTPPFLLQLPHSLTYLHTHSLGDMNEKQDGPLPPPRRLLMMELESYHRQIKALHQLKPHGYQVSE